MQKFHLYVLHATEIIFNYLLLGLVVVVIMSIAVVVIVIIIIIIIIVIIILLHKKDLIQKANKGVNTPDV